MNKNSRRRNIGLKFINLLAIVFVIGLFNSNTAVAEEPGIFGEAGDLPANTCKRSGCHEVAIVSEIAVPVPIVTLMSATAVPGAAVDAGTTHTFTLTMSGGPTAAVGNTANAGFSVAVSNGILSDNAMSPNPTHDSTAQIPNLSPVQLTFGDGLGGAIPGPSGPVTVATVGNVVTWTFDWTAPAQTAGEDVTIFAGVVAGDGDGTEKGPDAAGGIVGDGVTMLQTVITVNASPAVPPVAMITAPTTGTTGVLLNFDATGSTVNPAATITAYSWDFGDGGALGTGATTQRAYMVAGTYTISLTITDSLGATNTVSSSITITDNILPVAIISAPVAPVTAIVGTVISFDGSTSTDSDGTITNYEWNFGDLAVASGATATHAYTTVGTYTATLMVIDDLGGTTNATVTIDVTAAVANQAPVAMITAPTTGTVGMAVAFDGSGSTDADGTVASYAWDFADGTTGTLVSEMHTFTTAGTYAVTLTVTDDLGATSTAATASIVISAAAGNNVPPVAMITAPATGTVGTAVTFDGSGSTDADGTIASYAWDFADGTSGTLISETHTFANAGTYAVTLTVTDDLGAASPVATASIVISAGAGGNLPPIAIIAAPAAGSSTTVNTLVAFNATGSNDPDGTLTALTWDFGDGTSGGGLTAAHAYSAAGTYTVVLTVTDDQATSSTATVDVVVTVAGANQPPVAVITAPTTGTIATAVTFDGTGSTDADGTIATYEWDLGDGSAVMTGATISYSYTAAGTYTVTLTVTDDTGATNMATTSIVISATANVLPVAVITAPATGVAGVAITYDGTGSTDADGTIVSYLWDFGGAVTMTGATTMHTYTAAGTFTYTLRITDNAGGTNTATATIVISAAGNQPPVAVITGPTTGTEAAMITFSGSGSTDPEMGVLTYAWDITDSATGASVATATTVDITNAFAIGIFTVSLTVTDDAGLTANTTSNIVITAGGGAAQPPVADAGGPYNGMTAMAVMFDGTASMDPDALPGDVLIYDWDFGDNIVMMDAGATPSHTYTAAGTFTVTLTVTDIDGMTGSATTSAMIVAGPGAPPPVAGMGEALYNANCASAGCHGPVGTPGTAGDVTDEDAEEIEEAIEEESSMASLSVLSEEDIMMIAHYLNEGEPMEISILSTEETLFITFCASCHGMNGKGASAPAILNTTVEKVNIAIAKVSTMSVQVNMLSDQYIADIVTFLDQPEPTGSVGTGTNKPTTNSAVGDGSGGGGSLLWLLGLILGTWTWISTGRFFRRK